MKITTSNIRFDNPNDGDHDWNHRKDCLTKVLLKNSPDIIATQEGRRPQLMEFESLIKFNMIRSHRQWIEERMYPTIYTGNNINISASGDIWLSETPHIAGSSSFDSAFPRLCTWAKGNFEGNDFMIVNVHLDHVKNSTRENQINVLIQEINQIRNGLPLIVCGDFNSDPYSEVYNSLLESELNLYDPWTKFNKIEMSSHHKFDGDTQTGSRIDWIFLSKELEAKSISINTGCCDSTYPSDHFPVELEFNF